MQNFNDIPGSDNGSGNGSSSGEGIRHDGSERGGNGSAGSDDAIVFRVDETSDLPIWAQLRNRICLLYTSAFCRSNRSLQAI